MPTATSKAVLPAREPPTCRVCSVATARLSTTCTNSRQAIDCPTRHSERTGYGLWACGPSDFQETSGFCVLSGLCHVAWFAMPLVPAPGRTCKTVFRTRKEFKYTLSIPDEKIPSDRTDPSRELEDIAIAGNMPRFVGRQLAQWIYGKRVESFDEMNNISRRNREWLAEHYVVGREKPVKKMRSSDGTVKYLFPAGRGVRLKPYTYPTRNVPRFASPHRWDAR